MCDFLNIFINLFGVDGIVYVLYVNIQKDKNIFIVSFNGIHYKID